MKCQPGERYGALEVVDEGPPYIACGQKYRQVKVRCDCGAYRYAPVAALVRGDLKSCSRQCPKRVHPGGRPLALKR
jgi:hypothetical protein